MSRPQKGQRTPGSGRKKGTPNQATRSLRQICEDLGINPFQAMVQIAVAERDPRVKFEMLEKVTKYIEPQRKAIEMNANVNTNLVDQAQSILDLPEAELLKIVKEETKKLGVK